MSAHFLSSAELTGATFAAWIMRRDESPDAETTSKSPLPIFSNISSEVFATCTFAVQPVLVSNGVTQSTLGSVEPFSAYPGQARMLTAASPAPMLEGTLVVGGAEPLSELDPHPDRASAAIAPTDAHRAKTLVRRLAAATSTSSHR